MRTFLLYACLFALSFIVSVWTVPFPSEAQPLYKRRAAARETIEIDIMLLIDFVHPRNVEKETAEAYKFIQAVNNDFASVGTFPSAIIHLNLVRVETIPSFFSTNSNLHTVNREWQYKYKYKYGKPGHVGMLLSKISNDLGGWAQFQITNSDAPTGMLTGFTWDHRPGRVNTFAHEFGHILGFSHDELEGCGRNYLMSAKKYHGDPTPYSSCSITTFEKNKEAIKAKVRNSSSRGTHTISTTSFLSPTSSKAEVTTTQAVTSSNPSAEWYKKIPLKVYPAVPDATPNVVTFPPVPDQTPQPSTPAAVVQPTLLSPVPAQPLPSPASLPRQQASTFTSATVSEEQARYQDAQPPMEEDAEVINAASIPTTSSDNPMVSALRVAHDVVHNPLVKMAVNTFVAPTAPELIPLINTGMELARPHVESILQQASTEAPMASASNRREDRVQDHKKPPSFFSFRLPGAPLKGIEKHFEHALSHVANFFSGLFRGPR